MSWWSRIFGKPDPAWEMGCYPRAAAIVWAFEAAQIPVKVWAGKRNGVAHVQAIALIEGEWEWMGVSFKGARPVFSVVDQPEGFEATRLLEPIQFWAECRCPSELERA